MGLVRLLDRDDEPPQQHQATVTAAAVVVVGVVVVWMPRVGELLEVVGQQVS